MTLPATNNLGAYQINQELGRSPTATFSWNDSEARRLAATNNSGQSQSSETIFPVSNLLGKARNTVSVTTDRVDYNLLTAIQSNYVAGKTYTTLTIADTSICSASATSTYGLTVSGSSGDIFDVYNYGYIVGAGGQGGGGEAGSFNPPGGGGNDQGVQVQGTSGSPGGNAFFTNVSVNFWNYGNIWGGGGGGAGGYGGASGGKESSWRGGGGGGGGAGRIVGQGNVNLYNSAWPGSAGTLTAGGTGGAGNQSTGGSGGGPGQAGGYNQQAYPRLVGGAAGYYVSGNALVTWNANGDRRGQVG